MLYVGRLYGLMMGNGVKLKHLSCNQQHLQQDVLAIILLFQLVWEF